MWFVRTMFVPYLGKDSRKAAQGVQTLGRNEVTQNSKDIQVSALSAPQDALHGSRPCIEVRP